MLNLPGRIDQPTHGFNPNNFTRLLSCFGPAKSCNLISTLTGHCPDVQPVLYICGFVCHNMLEFQCWLASFWQLPLTSLVGSFVFCQSTHLQIVYWNNFDLTNDFKLEFIWLDTQRAGYSTWHVCHSKKNFDLRSSHRDWHWPKVSDIFPSSTYTKFFRCDWKFCPKKFWLTSSAFTKGRFRFWQTWPFLNVLFHKH